MRSDLGRTYSTARYSQAIQDANKDKRVAWCQKCLDKEKFDDVVFTDESTIQLESHRRSFLKKIASCKLKYRHKHPAKVHIWAGISKRGAMRIVMFYGTMNAIQYGDIFFSTSPIPFTWAVYPSRHRLYRTMTQSIPVATFWTSSRRIRSTGGKAPLRAQTWTLLKRSGGTMKIFLRDKHKPRNLGEHREVSNVSGGQWHQTCARYVNHLQKVVPDVVAVNGEPSGHLTTSFILCSLLTVFKHAYVITTVAVHSFNIVVE